MLIYNGEFGKSDREGKEEDNGASVAVELIEKMVQRNGGEVERQRILDHYRHKGQ